jgi:hypothetical protein
MIRYSLTLSLFFILSTLASAEEIVPLQFRGIPLGVSIDEFRARPFPDTTKANSVTTLCSNDRPTNKNRAHLPLQDKDLRKLGFVRCKFYSVNQSGKIVSDISPQYAGAGSFPTAFLFVPDESNVHRLYAVILFPHSKHFARIQSALTEAFGDATEHDKDEIQTKAGVKYENHSLVWRNKYYSISIKRYSGDINTSSVSYFDHKLVMRADELRKSLRKRDAKEL